MSVVVSGREGKTLTAGRGRGGRVRRRPRRRPAGDHGGGGRRSRPRGAPGSGAKAESAGLLRESVCGRVDRLLRCHTGRGLAFALAEGLRDGLLIGAVAVGFLGVLGLGVVLQEGDKSCVS